MNLWEELGNAALDVKKNPILIVPILLQVIFTITLSAIFLLLGIYFVTSADGKPFTFGVGLDVAAMQPSSWLIGGILFAFFLVIMFLVNAFFRTGFYAMAKEAAIGKTSWSAFSRGVKESFKNFLVYNIMYLVLFLLASIPLTLGVFLLTVNTILGVLIILFGVSFLFLVMLLAWCSLFFVPPIMFTRKLDAITSMKESWYFFTKNFLYVLGTLGITILASILVSASLGLLLMPFSMLASQLEGIFPVLLVFLNFIKTFLQIVLGIILVVFLFRAYNAKTAKKALKKTKTKKRLA